MPRPKKIKEEAQPQDEPVELEPIVPDEIPDSLKDTLGRRDVEHSRHARVQARHPQTGQPLFGDFGPMMTTQVVTEIKNEAQPILTLTEAKLLGKQNWEPWPDGGYKCIVKGRRFIVSAEVYKQLCQG